MKPEFMRPWRALAAAVAALLIAAGIVALSPAVSASAHHNTISVSASCTDYVWSITWTITNSEADKTETITSSSDQAIIATGTVLAASGTYTSTETVSGPTTKTLSIRAEWSNGYTRSNSATIWPGDFTGSCERPDAPTVTAPSIVLLVGPCITGGSLGAVTASLHELAVGSRYTLTLYSGADAELDTLTLTATGEDATHSFPGHGPGLYYAAVTDSAGGLLSLSSDVTIGECTPAPAITIELDPCPLDTATTPGRSLTVTVDGIAPSTEYTLELVTDDSAGTIIASTTTPADAATSFPHTFTGVPSPGDYRVTLAGGTDELQSDPISVPLCDLSTLAPPEIELITDQCDGEGQHDSLTAHAIELNATKTYHVRIVDSSGTTVAGGEDQAVTGVTTADLSFPGITAAGTYAAQLLVEPGKQLAATSAAVSATGACLPTLAMTGGGVLVPLGSVAALLLTLGGALVMGRLRRRMAL